MTFFIQTNTDPVYNKVMEKVRERSLTFSKDVKGGLVQLEVSGTVDDYKMLEQLINNANTHFGREVGTITEAI